jgi:predicted transcriptional regulator
MAVHLTPAQEQRLAHLAAQTEQTPDELAQQAVENFLTYQEAFLAAVKDGDDDFARGDVLEHEEVVAQIQELLKNG